MSDDIDTLKACIKKHEQTIVRLHLDIEQMRPDPFDGGLVALCEHMRQGFINDRTVTVHPRTAGRVYLAMSCGQVDDDPTPPAAAPAPIQSAELAELKRLAEAATPGDWIAKPSGRLVGGPLRHYVNGSAHAQIASFSVTFHDQAPDDEPERQQANAEFCAAARPAVILRLLAALAAPAAAPAPDTDAARWYKNGYSDATEAAQQWQTPAAQQEQAKPTDLQALTNADICELASESGDGLGLLDPMKFARAIERHLATPTKA